MIHIRVPATSANMGSGFDSIGIALQLYNNLWIEELDKRGVEIEIRKKQAISIPADKTNLIYRTMVDFYAEIGKIMPGVKIIQEDNIPVTRGLGSSAACIVAGLIAANHLSGCNYSKNELAQMAAKIEGHPDNTNPALFGGMVVGAIDLSDGMKFVKLDLPKNLKFAIMVPDFPISTEASREVLPEMVSRQDAIFNSSRAALLVASVITGNINNLGMAMDDRLHQPYRKQLIPEMNRIFKASKGYGALGAYLSGAGSTLMAVLSEENENEFKEKMSAYLESMPHEWNLTLLKPDSDGATLVSK